MPLQDRDGVDVYYFETTIRYDDNVGYIHLGWAKRMPDIHKNPLNEPDSIILHVANGKVYISGKPKEYCKMKIESNKIVGAYINRASGEAWFSVGGVSCGIAIQMDSLRTDIFYPTISSALIGSTVEFHQSEGDDHGTITPREYAIVDEHI